MVLRLKARESRSPPGLPTHAPHHTLTHAGWSSPVARQAHNLKVIGSNPIPATKSRNYISQIETASDTRSVGGDRASAPCAPREGKHAAEAAARSFGSVERLSS